MAKVLVIDDEEGIRNLLDTLLRLKGYDVILPDSEHYGWLDQSRSGSGNDDAGPGG
jgi:DNA-binding NtrC family response regulator